MTGFDREGEHSVVSGAVYIAGVFEIVNSGLNPAAAKGGGAVAHPVIVSEGRVHFFDKSSRIAGISAVMVELEDVGGNIDPAADDLALCLLLDIPAVEIGYRAGRDLGHEGIVVNVTGIVSTAAVTASPKNINVGIANCKRRPFLEINDLSSCIIGCGYNIVISVEEALAVTAGLSSFFEIGRVRQIYLAHIEPAVVKDRRDLVHVVVMIVGEIDVEGIEMMVIEIVHQSVVIIFDIGVHQKILSAAGDHR